MLSTDNGFQEAVAIVSNHKVSARRLTGALGYLVRHTGRVPPGALRLLGLPEDTAANETVIGHPDLPRGDIRLIEIAGTPASPMRGGGQAWDTGGIFDVNLRALVGGIARLHRALRAAGFVSHAPITDWQFGAMAVREVLQSDADGLCLALMERISPPLAGYDGICGPASWVFNATQIVADFDAARALYVDALGWQVVQETEGPVAPPPGTNCMGFPIGLAPDITMRIGIYHPHGRMEGSVEVIAFSCRGHDFSAYAPPGLGWAALRFAVSDLDGFAAALAGAGCSMIAPAEFDWAPHGRVRGVAGVTPWGVRLEGLMLLERAAFR